MSSAISGARWLVIEPTMGDQVGESEQRMESAVPLREPGCLQRHTHTPSHKQGNQGVPILRLGQR